MTAAVREEQIPAEFLYWEHVNSRRVQLVRHAWRTLWGFDPQPGDALVRRFARSFYEADPVAEAFVDDVYMERGAQAGRALLDAALEHGIDAVREAPDSMRALFTEFETDPEWLDRGQVELGARVFRRYGTSVFSFATTSTLEMYSESSVAKPLSLAGGYAGDTAHKRQLETVRFWIDISEPGGLDRGARGRAMPGATGRSSSTAAASRRCSSSPSCSPSRHCAASFRPSTTPPIAYSAGGATAGMRTRPEAVMPSSPPSRSSADE